MTTGPGLRDVNRVAVLALVGRHGPISRADIARRLGLSPPTVTAVTRSLMAAGVIRKVDDGSPRGGRPSELLAVVGPAAVAAGVKVAAGGITGVRADLDGTVLDTFSASFEEIAGNPFDGLARLLAPQVAAAADTTLLGVGLGVPGFVDSRTGLVEAPLLGWRHMPLREYLSQLLDVPVLVDNDVNTLAAYEHLYGLGRPYEDFLTVTLGRGIGAAIVAAGDLRRGGHGAAGELGHLPVDPDGPPCHCGKRGCLETSATPPCSNRPAGWARSAPTPARPTCARRPTPGTPVRARCTARPGPGSARSSPGSPPSSTLRPYWSAARDRWPGRTWRRVSWPRCGTACSRRWPTGSTYMSIPGTTRNGRWALPRWCCGGAMTGAATTTSAPPRRPVSVNRRRGRRPVSPRRLRTAAAAAAFLAPSLLPLLGFWLGPMVGTAWVSLQDWNLIGAPSFAGLDNYRELLGDAEFHAALGHTVLYLAGYLPLVLIFGLAIALLLEARLPAMGLLRAAFFLPVISSWVAVSLLWKWLLNPADGLVNRALRWLGVAGPGWRTDPGWAMPSVVLASVWKDVGFVAVLLLAGLQAIPRDLVEAAALDGAGWWRRLSSGRRRISESVMSSPDPGSAVISFLAFFLNYTVRVIKLYILVWDKKGGRNAVVRT